MIPFPLFGIGVIPDPLIGHNQLLFRQKPYPACIDPLVLKSGPGSAPKNDT